FAWDADALILYADVDQVIRNPAPDAHHTAFRRILYSVAYEVPHHLRQPGRVGKHRRQVAEIDHVEGVQGRCLHERQRRLDDQLADVHRLGRYLEPVARFEPGEVEQVIDDSGKLGRQLVDQALIARLQPRASLAGEQKFAQALDRRERRAQSMRGSRDERIL